MPGKPPYLAPPKTPASYRTVPLLQVVVDAMAAHLAAVPVRVVPAEITDSPRLAARRSDSRARRRVTFHDLRHY